jgi:hypothetical protein
MIIFIVLMLSAPVLGQSKDDEARKYLVRGMAAIEMAKSEAELANAAAEFKKATAIAPNMAAAWYNLGSVQVKIGQIKEAIESYRKYLALAPQAEDARRINDEIIKMEYRLERDNLSTMLAGTWTGSDGQTFKLLMNGSNLQLTRTEQRDDILNLKSMGTTYTGPMTDAPPLVFTGTLIGDKLSGQYLQAAAKCSGHCDMPERKGDFEGTVNVAAGQMRIVYNRVTLEYKMEFQSLLSSELVCGQTNRQDTPGYVLELKRSQPSPALPAGGIGCEISVNASGNLVVRGVKAGLPAEQAGLQKDDEITIIDGTDLTLLKTAGEKILKLRGQPGSTVQLVVKRPTKSGGLFSSPKEETINFAIRRIDISTKNNGKEKQQ